MCTSHGNLPVPLINKVLLVVGSDLCQVILSWWCSIHYKLGGSRGHSPPGNFRFLEPHFGRKFCTNFALLLYNILGYFLSDPAPLKTIFFGLGPPLKPIFFACPPPPQSHQPPSPLSHKKWTVRYATCFTPFPVECYLTAVCFRQNRTCSNSEIKLIELDRTVRLIRFLGQFCDSSILFDYRT